MHHRSTVPLAPLVALILAAGGGAAQTTYTLSPFVSVDGALPGDPLLAGLSVERARGTIGMRAGAAFDLAGAGSAAGDGRLGDAWTFDADLTLGLHRIPFLRGVLTGWAPRLSAGVGIAAGREADASRALVPVASWGFGLDYAFAGRLAAAAALRRRTPIEIFGGSHGVQDGWEYRAGLALRIGGGRAATRPPVVASMRARERDALWTSADLPADAHAAGLLETADDYLGTRYLWGGDSPETGFDCSGFVQYVFARRGVRLPRTSRQLAVVGRTVEPRLDALRAGDLLFFAGDYRTIDHVAIYAGAGTIIHSSNSAGGVVVDRLSTNRGRWFTDHLVAARRVVEGGRSLVAAAADPAVPPGSWDPPDRAPRRN